MGCASSAFLSQDDEFTQIGGSAAAGFSHHIVSLTSTTYGLLTLDRPSTPPPSSSPTTTTTTSSTTTMMTPPTPPPRFTLGSLFPSPLSSQPRPLKSNPPDIINSWELMADLNSTTTPTSHHHAFAFPPVLLQQKPNKENSNPNLSFRFLSQSDDAVVNVEESKKPLFSKYSLDGFEPLCPPNGENKLVVYTTTLRGVRRTFESCNAVRSAFENLGVFISERDISMDKGFKDELRELMKGKESSELLPPRVFVKGRYIGGVEEVMKIVEEGCMGDLVAGLPKIKNGGYVCEGCGGVRFLPCFTCNGSCKVVMAVKNETVQEEERTTVVRCPDCNENGLVLCPICT